MVASLGGSEQAVTTEQMRQAVATWYLNLEREETDSMQLFYDAQASFAHQVWTGRKVDYFVAMYQNVSRGTLLSIILVGAMLGIGTVALPFIEMGIGRNNHSKT